MNKLYRWRRSLAVLLLLLIAVFAFLPCYRLTVIIDREPAESRFGLGIGLSFLNPQYTLIEENPQTKPFSLVEGLIGELAAQGQSLAGVAVAAGAAALLTVAGIVLFLILLVRSLRGRFSRSWEILAYALFGTTILSGGLFWLAGRLLSSALSSPAVDLSYIGQGTVDLIPDYGWILLFLCQLLLAVGMTLLRVWNEKQTASQSE